MVDVCTAKGWPPLASQSRACARLENRKPPSIWAYKDGPLFEACFSLHYPLFPMANFCSIIIYPLFFHFRIQDGVQFDFPVINAHDG